MAKWTQAISRAWCNCSPDDPNLAYIKGNRFFDPQWSCRGCRAITGFLGTHAYRLWLRIRVRLLEHPGPDINGYLAFSRRPFFLLSTTRRFADTVTSLKCRCFCEFGLKRASIVEMEMDIDIRQRVELPVNPYRGRFLHSLRSLRRIIHPDASRSNHYLLLRHKSWFTVHYRPRARQLSVLWHRLRRIFEWVQKYALTGVPRTTGTVMLGVLPYSSWVFSCC